MSWLTSEQALAALKVQPQTLYANVSRGKIRAKPDPMDTRRSLYNGDDVRRLAGRHAGRRSAAAVAAETIFWGEPVLVSGLSTVAQGRLWYRGQDAARLAETATLEEIATLLWDAGGVHFGRAPHEAPPPAPAPANPLEAGLLALARRAGNDPPAQGRSGAVLCREAAGLVAEMAGAMLGAAAQTGGPLHRRVAAAWEAPAVEDLVRRALVLLADHELNASTFAARVTASTGAPVSASLLAGLATLAGPLHGGAAMGTRALVDAARRNGAVRAVRDWLAQGRPLPAFGHRLYPDGDPRAAALFARFQPDAVFTEIREAVEALTGEQPNIDFAVAALCDAHGLPASAPLTLFAVARSVGWTAHILEQTTKGTLIRPRAQYDGPPPAG
ncbi:citrate synthase [Labrys monachus]|uniref:citrate synthase (unknown stereospecificity) n=1 Tax=Labrys monachus TaxID=217067 RepID=A0ABU0FMI8_9HYPH|nr:citrate synthase [Labrys monachus]MDQ0395830.1 citrate synthase [Labrys monachus]